MRKRNRSLRALVERVSAMPMEAAAKVLPAVPLRVALAFSDLLGSLLCVLDRRGRRVAMQNLVAVFGDEMSPRERRRVRLACYRNAVQSLVLLFHLQPLTPERFRSIVRIAPEDDATLSAFLQVHPRVVIVSGHFGDWELLVAARRGVTWAPDTAYLTESSGWVRVDALLDRLRDRGAGGSARRKHGSMALKKALEDGRSVSLLVDRNVRGTHGGRYVPFLGIPARTTPLAAVLARRCGVPLVMILLVPEGRARWRLWASPVLSGPETDDAEADAAATMGRVNDVLSRVIREKPEAWAWMIKRWKSRPTPELGPYPAYSIYDPDE
jgi:KDO2-lipid IV(A) lauroyltransferase